jgi:hypothetical protein
LACLKGFSYEFVDRDSSGNYINYDATKTDFVNPESPEFQAILKGLNNIFNTKMKVMLTDKTVSECMNGKDVSGFNADNTENSAVTTTNGKNTRTVTGRVSNASDVKNQDTIYENLMDSYQQVLISKSLELMREKYDEAEKSLAPKIDSLNNEISQRLSNIEGVKADEIHKSNLIKCFKTAFQKNLNANDRGNCDGKDDKREYVFAEGEDGKQPNVCKCFRTDGFCEPGSKYFFSTGHTRNRNTYQLKWYTADYDKATGTCTITPTTYDCTSKASPYCWNWDKTGVKGTPEIEKMPVYNREKDLLNKDTKPSDGNGDAAQ